MVDLNSLFVDNPIDCKWSVYVNQVIHWEPSNRHCEGNRWHRAVKCQQAPHCVLRKRLLQTVMAACVAGTHK